MALQLRNGEELVSEVHFHWSAILLAKIWAGLGTLLVTGQPLGDKAG